MKMKLAITIALLLALAGCGDSSERAIGLYRYQHALSGSEKIAEVKKDGDAYLFVEDVIRNSNAIALSKTTDGLSYNAIALKISEDGNTIYFGPINGTRVDGRYLSDRLAAIESNKKACVELQSEVDGKRDTLPAKQWNEYVASVKQRTPADCRIVGANTVW